MDTVRKALAIQLEAVGTFAVALAAFDWWGGFGTSNSMRLWGKKMGCRWGVWQWDSRRDRRGGTTLRTTSG